MSGGSTRVNWTNTSGTSQGILSYVHSQRSLNLCDRLLIQAGRSTAVILANVIRPNFVTHAQAGAN